MNIKYEQELFVKTIVLRHNGNNSDHGEEIDVTVFNVEFENDIERIDTDKGVFIRKWEDYSINSPFGWSEAHD